MRRGCLEIFLLLMVLLTRPALAEVSLPLDGYCRVGRFFPVVVNGSDVAREIVFSAEGCLPCSLDPSAGGKVVVPMLVTSRPRELHWSGSTTEFRNGSITLRTPDDDERLIASVTDHTSDVATVFPGKRLLPIHLDPADLLPGPPAVWEALDAVVLDASLFQRITDAQRSAFLGGGVMLISVGDQPPDRNWPWKKAGTCWVLSCPVAGPLGEMVNENIYAPTYAWTPGWSRAVRGQVVGAAVILFMVILALVLRPNRWRISAAVMLCIFSSLGVVAWRYSLGSVDRAGGDILVANDGLLQRDAYVFERARASAERMVPWAGWTHPLFSSANALKTSEMRIDVSGTGQMSFRYQAVTGHTLAFLRREVEPGSEPDVIASKQSPMREAVAAEYLNAGGRVVGQVRGGVGRWDSVVVSKIGNR